MPSPVLPPPRQTSSVVDRIPERPATSVPQRIALWEIEGSLQCSIIGTCLSDQDLRSTIRKHALTIDKDAQSYDIHAYCVRATNRDCALARSLNKLLERRYAGTVRLMGRASTPDDMRSLWERLRDSGQVAAGYWAVMSHAHIPAVLKTKVFGEVHMLSHLHGHGATHLATRLCEAQHRCSDLEARLRRSEASKLEALAQRDAVRATTVAGPIAGPAHSAIDHRVTPDRMFQRLQQKLAKCERALIIARSRARQAEVETGRLMAARTAARRSGGQGASLRAPTPIVAPAQTAPSQTRHRILYIGGRTGIVPHLRTAAEARTAAFYHHDGGIEDSLHRIEEMIEGCDAVVCPVDCVSHGACRMAKAICQRLNRRFLPIPTASRSGFERALDQLAGEPGQGSNEGVGP